MVLATVSEHIKIKLSWLLHSHTRYKLTNSLFSLDINLVPMLMVQDALFLPALDIQMLNSTCTTRTLVVHMLYAKQEFPWLVPIHIPLLLMLIHATMQPIPY